MECLKNIYICFPEGKHKVLTMSYDDGREEDRRLIEIMNRYGIKGTFHLNSGLVQGRDRDERRILPEEWKNLYAGHEVSCHTVTHPTISRCSTEHVAVQILEDRRYLEQIMRYPIRGMSYPNGAYTKEIITLLSGLGIEYSRVVETTGTFQMPENFYEWKGTCHHNQQLLKRAEEFLHLHKNQYLYMMYVWGHSYEFTEDDNWELIDKFCRMVGWQEDIWYATNIEIVDYMKCARMVKFTVDGTQVYNMSAKDVWLSVDGKVLVVKSGELLNV